MKSRTWSRKLCAHKRTEEENVLLRETVAEVARPDDIVGQSSIMQQLFDAIETVGPTDATVLITGESGTGKELVARAIHHASPRKFHPLVVIHCGALTGDTCWRASCSGTREARSQAAQHRKKGKVRNCRGRSCFPRRDRRHQLENPDRPAARAAGARDCTGRRKSAHQGRFPLHRRDQQGSGAGD